MDFQENVAKEGLEFLQERRFTTRASQAIKCQGRESRLVQFSDLTDPEWLGLHVAAFFGLTTLFQLLIDELLKVEVEMDFLDARHSQTRTLLAIAAQYGYDDIVKMLLDLHPDPVDVNVNAEDKYGDTPLHYAAEYGYASVVFLLDPGLQTDLDSRDVHGQTPLSRAAKHGHGCFSTAHG